MPTPRATVEVRMYNVGFGDAFRVIVRRGDQSWRMLVDCGVHNQGLVRHKGQKRPIGESVATIIADLEKECDGQPELDVIVATHHHADHISGFAEKAWEKVKVGEVWVPFVEDPADPAAKVLRRAQAVAARKLKALIEARQHALGATDERAIQKMGLAMEFAVNSSRNEIAMDRLLGRSESTKFANPPEVRYLPYADGADNRIDVGKCGAVAHILGPPRDPALVKKMHPPKSAGWLTLNLDDDGPLGGAGPSVPLFNNSFVVPNARVHRELRTANEELKLGLLTNDDGLLAAASILERSVNNTSLFFVLDVSGTRFLFPGDAQHGAWEHVRSDPESLALITDVDFYKVGHHGSHNATPKPFIENEWKRPGDAMVPWGLVKAWKETIPKQELMTSLKQHRHRVVRPDKVVEGDRPPRRGRPVITRGQFWRQLTFTTKG